MKNNISNDTLIDELNRLAKILGKTPSRTDMRKYGNSISKNVFLYYKRFGTLSSAHELAGLELNGRGAYYNEISEKYIIEKLIELGKFLNHTPSYDDIHKYCDFCYSTLVNKFGSFEGALGCAGFHTKKYLCEDIVNDIRRIYVLIGHSPSIKEFNKMSQTVSWQTAAKKIVGINNWNKTLISCGIEPATNKNIDDGDLKNELIRMKSILGHVPTHGELRHFGKINPITYTRRFGSYAKAIKYFGFDIDQKLWNNQKREVGVDGQIYKSKFEASVANVLFNLKNDKIIQNYEYEKEVCADRKWSCDFLITGGNKLWLELDGMGNQRKNSYDIFNEKIEYYRNNNFNFKIVKYHNRNIEKIIKNIIDGL